MKLLGIELFPFAGFVRQELRFSAGLNVLIGANDKGKSTIFRAIDSALFLPIKISRSTKEGRDLLPRVVPLGGDHARVRLKFERKNQHFELEKCWGQGASISLALQDGARLQQEDKVEERLRALLPVPGATFQSVLLMGQGSLEGTVRGLQEQREALHSLGDLLRLTVDQTAGVSVERLKDMLRARISECFEHWDIQNGLPEKGKGIDDPWKKGLGKVLAAYYAREGIRRSARETRQREGDRDRIAALLAAKLALRDEARAFVSANQDFVGSVSSRQALELQVTRGRSDGEAMVRDLDAWAKAEAQRGIHGPEVARVESERARLEAELKDAFAQGKKREAQVRLLKARAARARIEEAKEALRRLLPITPDAMRRVRQAQQEVDGLRTSLKSGKIQLQFEVKEDLEVLMRKDLEAERKGVMTPAKPLVLNAGGRIHLSSRFFELTVTSGDGKAAEIEELFARKSDGLGKILAELGVDSLEKAQECQEKFSEALLAVKGAEALLAGLLAPGEKLEELERIAGGAGEGGAGREPSLIQMELQSKLADLAGRRDSLVRAESLIQGLERRYGVGDSSQLMEKLIGIRAELTEAEKKLAALPLLPSHVGDLSTFIQRFERFQSDSLRLTDEVGAQQVELAELKASLPDQSAEDLERAAREAEAQFLRELARGKALLRVESAVQALDGAAGDVFGNFRGEFERLVKALSAGKYGKAGLKDGLPTLFERGDGAGVPYEWLSAGTKDAFALALRLAMASYFLGEAEGFLLVDDPLVNMDPERQKIAAGMLREFAARRQVVIFTCHPAHAELLGGNRIEI